MRRVSAAVASLLVLVSACTGAPPASTAPVAAPQKPEAPDPLGELYTGAKTEGELVWEIGGTPESVNPVIEGFEARFPGIRVKTVSASAPATVARLVSESAAGKVSVDVAMATVTWAKPLVDRDLLTKVDWGKFGPIDPKALMLDGRLLEVYGFPNVIIYNTNLVPPNDVPKTWEDLLSPRWRGQITVPLTTIGVSVLFQVWDESKADKYLEALREQRLVADRGATSVAQRVANGETALGDTIITLVPGMKDQGMPLDVAPISPQRDSPYGVYTVKGAPHPNAARLLMAWMMSREGREAWRKTGRGPSAPCNASAYAQILCDKGIRLMTADTVEKAAKEDEWIERTRTLLGLRPPQ